VNTKQKMTMAMGIARAFGSNMQRMIGQSNRLIDVNFASSKKSECMYTISRRWATKKAGGSTKNGRDSESKRLGVKKFGG
jgi:hypothetical protein